MDERCEIIKHFGGKFYSSLAEWPGLSITLEDGVARVINTKHCLRKCRICGMKRLHLAPRLPGKIGRSDFKEWLVCIMK